MADVECNENLGEPQLPADASPEKIAIFEAVTGFYHSDAAELPLPQFTRPKARIYVHEVADSYGLYHRSEGKGKERHVTLAKTAPKATCNFYDHESQKWKPYNFSEGDEIKNNVRLGENRTLRCLTFNVLHEPVLGPEEAALALKNSESSEKISVLGNQAGGHDPTCAELRTPKCFDFLQSRQAHIITLNEVSTDFHTQLLQQDWAKSYWITDYAGSPQMSGNLILSRFPVKSCYFHTFKMSFKVNSVIEIVIPDTSATYWISTAHLKAGPLAVNGRFRRSQAHEMISQLKYVCPSPNWIIMGDLNIRDSENETLQAFENWTDSWTVLHPGDPGITYDPWTNSLAEYASNRICSLDPTRVKVANRYDRILFRSPYITPISAEILAREPTGTMPNGTPLYISDHFALEAVLGLA